MIEERAIKFQRVAGRADIVASVKQMLSEGGQGFAANCEATDPLEAAREIMESSRDAGCRFLAADHFVAVLPGSLAVADVRHIEQSFCEARGGRARSRVSVLRERGGAWHLYLILNRVHPKTLEALRRARSGK